MDTNARKLLFILSLSLCVFGVRSQDDTLCTYTSDSGARGNVFVVYNVREDASIGDVIAHVLVNGDNSEIALRSETNAYFSLDPLTRNISVTSSLVHQNRGYRLSITCRVLDPADAFETELEVSIFTLDLNDHAPHFINAPYKANVSELAPVGSTVLSTISATDEDTSNPFVIFSVLPGEYSDHFEFPLPAQGRLVLTQQLDFEQVQTVVLTIQVTDNHPAQTGVETVQLNSTTTVTVTVFDENDQNPAFFSSIVSATVTEADSVGTVISTQPLLQFYDPDLWQNSSPLYSIVNDTTADEDSYFAIDENTGELTLARTAPARGTKLCVLTRVSKRNAPDRYAHALLRVWVQSANENPPRFQQQVYTATLVENSVIGTIVSRVQAVDNDEATVLQYTFLHFYPGFTIDPTTGTITTTTTLDYEQQEQHSIIVQASDGRHTSQTEVIVDVIDVNDHNPQFSETQYTVMADDIVKDEVFLQLQATDADRNSVVTYAFLHASTHTNFSLNEFTGELTCLIENVGQASLVVIAQDNGSPPRMASCLVRLVATVTSPPVVSAASSDDDSDSNMAAVIALAVLCALLFVVVVVLVVFIIRNSQRETSKTNSSCVRSQSFEQNPVNFASKDYKSYLDPVDTYKPSSRHLQLYNGVVVDDATSTQENPFSSENSLDQNAVMASPSASYAGQRLHIQDLPSHTAAVEAGLYPQRYRLSDATVESSSDRLSGSTLPRNNSEVTRHQAQIEYDNSVVPIDVHTPRINGFHGAVKQDYLQPIQDEISPRSSVHSENSYNNGELSSFKVGSTTQLVPSAVPKSLRSLNKGSGNISFVDNSPTNSMYSSMTSQQSGMEPGSSGDHHKPGITVYY